MIERVAKAPLWQHVAGVAVVLVLLLLAVRPLAPYTSDEGSAVLQARQLERTGHWTYPVPSKALDPTGAATVVPHADVGEKGRAFYAKHPGYPELLRFADNIGGRVGMFLLSVVGAVVACLFTGLLAREIGAPSRASIWLLVLATPLVFDSFELIAHTLLAACAAAAVWCCVRGLRSERSLWWLPLTFVLPMTCALIRSEGAFVGPALFLACLAVAQRNVTAHRLALGISAVVGTVVGLLFQRELVRSILGTSLPMPGSGDDVGWLDARVRGALWTLLFPGATASWSDAILFCSLIFVVAAALIVRVGARRDMAAALAAAAALCWVAVACSGRAETVPGLLITFPLGTIALVLVRSNDLAGSTRRLLAVFAVAGASAVLLTQYSTGGGPEWGGRYFAYILPVVVPLVVAVLQRAGVGLVGRRLVIVVVCGVTALDFVALHTLQAAHSEYAAMEPAVNSVLAASHGQTAPVVIWTERFRPQMMWDGVDSTHWLVVDTVPLEVLLVRVLAAGAHDVVVITTEIEKTESTIQQHGFTIRQVSSVGGHGRVAIAISSVEASTP